MPVSALGRVARSSVRVAMRPQHNWNNTSAHPAPLEQIAREVNRVVRLPDVQERLAGLGAVGRGSTPDEMRRLVAGDVEHRDFVLGPDEQATQIMVCVSRARGGELVLDL